MNSRLFWFFAVCGALLASAAPASAAVVINEIESDDPAIADYVELMNTGAAPVDIGGYVIKDSNDNNSFTIPSPTIVAGGDYYVRDTDAGPNGFGLGSSDAARLFAPADLVNPIDSYSWTSHAATTYGRCPNGTGPIGGTNGGTRGAANNCPAPASAWPGSPTIATASNFNFNGNLSGLAYQPSGTSAPGVLWAVRNNPSTLFRLVLNGTTWTLDPNNGWANGKTLVFPDGSGVPDAEGVTLAGDANGIYVSIERNDSGAAANVSRPGILRYDVTAPGTTLTATKDFNLTADLPGLAPNAGLEAVTWIPDDVLVAKGLLANGVKYKPADYPDHGTGLFFAGVEQDGRIIAYALNLATGGFTRIASIASGFPAIMDLTYEPETKQLWAVCDNTCDGRTAKLDVATAGADAGKFVVNAIYARPAGMSNLNNEGFAIAPQAECVNGLKPVYYADDTNDDFIELRSGKLNCTSLAAPPTPTPVPTVVPTPSPIPVPKPAVVDRTAPKVTLTLKVTKTGTYAVRRTGKFRATITLNERADLTLTATVRKSAKAKARKILTTTRRGVAAGRKNYTLGLKRSIRRALRRGYTITLTVKARDAAGNTGTGTAKAKVR